jgi:hypothetical protein
MLSTSVKDNEQSKFRDSDNGVKVAVVIENNETIDAIMNASDRVKFFTWLDVGTNSERISKIEYNSPSFGATIIRYTYNYTHISGSKYRLDSETVTIV